MERNFFAKNIVISKKAAYLQHENPPSLSTMLKCAGRFFYVSSKTYSSTTQPHQNALNTDFSSSGAPYCPRRASGREAVIGAQWLKEV
jgi:hypothetical protein